LSTGGNDSALLIIREMQEANASFTFTGRIGRTRGMPGTEVPSDLRKLWDELVSHSEEQMVNTFYIIAQKVKSAWDTVLSQRLDYVKGKVSAIDELMVCPDTPENYEQLTVFLKKWTRISDGDLWLIVSQYLEYLQVTILMVTLVVLTKILKKLSKKT
jgi:hypothetical protein